MMKTSIIVCGWLIIYVAELVSLFHFAVQLCASRHICEIHHVALHDTSATSSQGIGHGRFEP